MNILYAYRYGIVGGVSTQLRLRQHAMRASGHRCDLFFSQDNGLRAVLQDEQGVYFGSSERYARLLRRGAYDHVVVIDTPELLLASHALWWQKPRQVWLDVHTTTTTGLGYLAQVNIKKLAGVMVPTHYSSVLVRERLPAVQPLVVPNVIDGAVFSPGSVVVNAENSVRQFVWVGKLDSHKNWRLALVYARLLQELFGVIRFTVVGGYTAPAATGQAFFEQADRLGILQAVRWIDRIDNTSLAVLYRQCAGSGGAMVVTSRDESFGMAAAEALMCGCPLITNDLPVFREVFPDSEMIKRVDIWQPEQFERAAKVLAGGVAPGLRQRMHEQLSSQYGPEAFMAALSRALDNR